MNPIAHWHAEHEYFRRLLGLLQKEVDRFHRGARPNYELMADIVSYLRDYGDHVHHPREDVAFARLAQHCPDMRLALDRLEQEHRVIAQAGTNLLEEIEAVVGGAFVPRARVEMAAATYLVYYGNHISKEEEDVLSRAAQHLTAEDWEAVRAALPGRPEALAGSDTQERYRELRRRIALEA